MSELILGTFNLNNLFGRYDFKASLSDVKNRPARGLKDDQYVSVRRVAWLT